MKYFNFAMFICRTKYYGGQKMAQSSIVVCGLGYNPTEVQVLTVHKFDKIENAVFRDVQIRRGEFNIGIEQFIYD
jgi:hypothetical protein